MSYEDGIFWAFLIWCFYTINLIIKLNSTANENLQKVGLRLSWLTLQPVEITARYQNMHALLRGLLFFALLLFGLVLTLLSWLYVALVLGETLYRWQKDLGAPEEVKSVRWRLRNVEMNFDEVVELLMKLSGRPENEADACKTEIRERLNRNGVAL